MKNFWKDTLRAYGRMLLEIFLLFPLLLVLGNALMNKAAMLPVFFAELVIAGLLGVLLCRLIRSTPAALVIGAGLCIGEVLLFNKSCGIIWSNAGILPFILALLAVYRGGQHAHSAWHEILPGNILFMVMALQFIVLLAAYFYGITEDYFTLLCILVPIVYITAFAVLNHLGLRNVEDEAQPRSGASTLSVIGDMKPVNLVLLAILLIVAVALSLGTVLITAAGWIFDKILFAIGWAAALFARFIDGFTFTTGVGETPIDKIEYKPSDMTPGPVWDTIGYICVGLLAIGFLILLFISVRRLIRMLLALLAKSSKPGKNSSNKGAPFEDTREKLLDLSELPKLYAQSARDRLSGMFKRPPGWDDMPTSAEKLKYLYRTTLHKAEENGYRHRRSYTAREATRIAAQSWKALGPEARTLADAYDALRYGAHDPDPEKLEALHHRLGNL